jgi:hypothetical protein
MLYPQGQCALITFDHVGATVDGVEVNGLAAVGVAVFCKS